MRCDASACRSKKALRATEQDRPDVAARRKLWKAAQPFIDPHGLVFLDETGVNTKMARLHGWAPVGERCRDSVPFGHWKSMTFVAGLRLSGLTAPWLLDGPMNGEAFRVYVRQVLAPTLRPGDVVVVDATGVVRIPADRADDILADARAYADGEERVLDGLANGQRLVDAYGMKQEAVDRLLGGTKDENGAPRR